MPDDSCDLDKMRRIHTPVFIIGSPRSGTSLLRLILTCNPSVIIPPECGFILWLYEKHRGWIGPDCDNENKITEFNNDLFCSKKFDTWGLTRDEIKSAIIEFKPTSYAELCGSIYFAFAGQQKKQATVWGDKNNYYLNHLAEISKIFPYARYLHIVRDGRDVACSYREVMSINSQSPYAPNLPTGIEDIASEWSSNVLRVDSFLSSLPLANAMTVRYEDLVNDTDRRIREIPRWLGIEFEPSMLDFYRSNQKLKLEPDLTLDWKKRTLEPINSSTIGRYKANLCAFDQECFLKVAKDALRQFGYESQLRKL